MRISDWSSDVCSSDLHEVALLDADAVLAGHHAADLDAEPQDVGAEILRPLQFPRLVGVVEDERMQVAVAGVEHVGDPQRSEESRVGKECVSTCRSRWSPYH